ncbi:hypothetical protein NL108_015607 [Boleophthalmus pectinirostris]|uniref:E3 ubiquitin-protein ligase TRIM35-like n=1 Tax=Boleophthalmus pectinirostris TaxID=150288 RepID=UPI00242EF43D|nr:E3 ubiquitin-protein ligase TRIM35-like [Boleophthalmus pectinirostris]XP_055021615.1 E3 ubiquitin-protein ligase TRIM35-like [Boleophthalmus pectinirostris]KAJ0064822.1 hypothetical protein NL108_015607 [Boleophthalmus pectinirostris]
MDSKLEEDLTCPICYRLFRDPVVLSCSHSFCEVCLQVWWMEKPVRTCAVCKRKSSQAFPPISLALRNLVQTFEEHRGKVPSELLCGLHSEQLRLFCVDHQQPVCLICRDSRTHKDHRFSPMEEAAEDLREHLRTSIKTLQDKLQVLTGTKHHLEDAAAHISAQARQTEAQIRQQFKTLHQFLLDEEDTRMKDVREEEEQKTQSMKEKLDAVSRELETASTTIREAEEQLRATDASFLLQYKSTAERIRRHLEGEETKMERGALLDQAKHVGNLGFNIWRNMKTAVRFYPVILDPNTAAPELVLSEDLSSVRRGTTQKLPQNPDRCTDHNVFRSKVFRSGTHSWDVEVGDNKRWSVGVSGLVLRDGRTEPGGWFISFSNGEYSACSHPDPVTPLPVTSLQRLRVKLDFNEGTVIFSDPDTNADLSVFTGAFTDGLIPYLFTEDDNIPLKILPKDAIVKRKY